MQSPFGLGFVAEYKRRIRDGSEYDRLFPRIDGRDTVIKKDAGLEDTVSFMQRTVRSVQGDTARLAPLLRGRNLRDTCKNVWGFVYWHIQYELDKPGVEQIRRPARAWADRKRGVDCDCYSVFISTVLLNLGIPHSFRITKYLDDEGEPGPWQHVYITVPDLQT